MLFVQTGEKLVDRLNLLVAKRRQENLGISLSQVDIDHSILWEAVRSERLGS
jgi:hypothetical protein